MHHTVRAMRVLLTYLLKASWQAWGLLSEWMLLSNTRNTEHAIKSVVQYSIENYYNLQAQCSGVDIKSPPRLSTSAPLLTKYLNEHTTFLHCGTKVLAHIRLQFLKVLCNWYAFSEYTIFLLDNFYSIVDGTPMQQGNIFSVGFVNIVAGVN